MVQSRADATLQKMLIGDALEAAPVAIFVKDEYGRYVATNAAASELTGYSREELLELPPEALSGRDELDLQQKLAEFRASDKLPGRGPLRRKDGEIIEIDYRWLTTTVGELPFLVFFLARAGEPMFSGG